MRVREGFVARATEPGANVAVLCREFGISRKTGYKWIGRFRDGGLRGLEDQSRRPKSCSFGISAEMAADIVALRIRHGWGPRKLRPALKPEKSRGERIPSLRTIARVLERAGLVKHRASRPRRPSAPSQAPRPLVTKSNDLWTIDFKGWWLSPSGKRCEPLTVRDAHSRFVLAIRILKSTRMEPVRSVLEELFETYGLPRAIMTDNGTPFAARHGALGLTALSAWWISLGIEPIRTRPATPSDNGAHERLHRDMQEDLERGCSLARRQGSQEAWDHWRNDFNQLRPHEALGMKTPGAVYRRSRRAYSERPVLLSYPKGFDVRQVDKIGKICLRGDKLFLSHALRAQQVGLERISQDRMQVWFGAKLLGQIDLTGERLVLATP